MRDLNFRLTASITMPKSPTDSLNEAVDDTENTATETASNEQKVKFAALTAAVSDILLDDETSPSDSLISSASDDIALKKTKKQINDSIKEQDEEKDIDEISPIFDVPSPVSHGTPTHASNSFSFSDGDGGRDFLIDDEIADQPEICIGKDNNGKIMIVRQFELPL